MRMIINGILCLKSTSNAPDVGPHEGDSELQTNNLLPLEGLNKFLDDCC